jgi:hypothetical protein
MRHFATLRTQSGAVIKAGLNPQAQRRTDAGITGKWRAVVVNTYVTDDGNSRTKREVECDVLLVRNNVFLQGVPVVQQVHGVHDADLWVPKPSTKTQDTQLPLNLTLRSRQGTFQAPATGLADLDGDHVLVEFIENDRDFPAIVGAWTHRHTKRKVIAGDGWSPSDYSRGTPHSKERYFSHAGTELRVNSTGDVLLNTDGANIADPLLETPNPLLGGSARLNLKLGQSLTVSSNNRDEVVIFVDPVLGLSVKLGANATDVVALKLLVEAELQKIINAFNAHTHPVATQGTAAAQTGTAAVTLSPITPPGNVGAQKVQAE